jgi:hypothetical protein
MSTQSFAFLWSKVIAEKANFNNADDTAIILKALSCNRPKFFLKNLRVPFK